MSRTARFAVLTVLTLIATSCSGSCAGDGRPRRGDSGSGGGDFDTGTVRPPTSEQCNEVDDTGEGVVDEYCACSIGQTQPCWPATPGRRGFGACRDGVQRCEAFGEFESWGACAGAVVPSGEIEGNCIDEDCDGNAPGCGTPCGEIETCNNGNDDDCDGLADCDDPDCASTSGCASSCVPSEFGEAMCSDGRDNDCDGRSDCVDPECVSAAPCAPPPPPPPGCTREFPFFAEIACGDGRDNDCDSRIDCADSDCMSPGNCGCDRTETMCTDGRDQDCDDSTDCADTDCQRCTPGTARWCDDPVYCYWGRQDCNPDGTWGACIETDLRPGSCTGNIYSRECCLDAGGCCENYPTDRSSVGNCAGIAECRTE